MPERSDVYAYFWVQGFTCSPEEVTALLGFTPSSLEAVRTAERKVLPSHPNMWLRQSSVPRGDSLLQDHLEGLLQILEPHREAVVSFASKGQAGINCVGYYYGANPGLHLSASLLARLTALELPVDFDLYNYSEAESAA
jgi:Domain of unknown function (DUF4279)